jgi:hypothetical protein
MRHTLPTASAHASGPPSSAMRSVASCADLLSFHSTRLVPAPRTRPVSPCRAVAHRLPAPGHPPTARGPQLLPRSAQPGRSADLRTIGMRSSSRPYDLAALEFADDDLAGLSGRINASHHCGTGAHFPSSLAQYRDLLCSRFWPVQPNSTTLPQPDSKRSKVSWRTRKQTPARCRWAGHRLDR